MDAESLHLRSPDEQRLKNFVVSKVHSAVGDYNREPCCRARLLVILLSVITPLFVASLVASTFTNRGAINTLLKEVAASRNDFTAQIKKNNADFTETIISEIQALQNFLMSQGEVVVANTKMLVNDSFTLYTNRFQITLIDQEIEVKRTLNSVGTNITRLMALVVNSTLDIIDEMVPILHSKIADGISTAVTKILYWPVVAGQGYASLYSSAPVPQFNSIDEQVWQQYFKELWLDLKKTPVLIFTGVMGPNHGPNVTNETDWTEIGCTQYGTFYATNYETKSQYEFLPRKGLQLENKSDAFLVPFYVDAREYSENCGKGIPGYANDVTVYNDLCGSYSSTDPKAPNFSIGYSSIVYQHPMFEEERYKGSKVTPLARGPDGRLLNASAGTVESCRSFELSTSFVSTLLREYMDGQDAFALIMTSKLEVIAGSGFHNSDLFNIGNSNEGKHGTNLSYSDAAGLCTNLQIGQLNESTARYKDLDVTSFSLTDHPSPRVKLLASMLSGNMTRLDEPRVSWLVTQDGQDYVATCNLLSFYGLNWHLCLYTPADQYTKVARSQLKSTEKLIDLTSTELIQWLQHSAENAMEQLRGQLSLLKDNSSSLIDATQKVLIELTRVVESSNAKVINSATRQFSSYDRSIDTFNGNTAVKESEAQQSSLKGIWLNVGLFALMLIGCAVVITAVVRPLFRLKDLMRMIADMEVENVEQPNSLVYELDDMCRSFYTMIQCMRVYKSYLPQGLFEDHLPGSPTSSERAVSSDRRRSSGHGRARDTEWHKMGSVRTKLTNGAIIVVKLKAKISVGMSVDELLRLQENVSCKVDEIVNESQRGKILCICGEIITILVESISNLREIMHKLMSVKGGLKIACSRSPMLIATLGSGSYRTVNAIGPAVSIAQSMIRICEYSQVDCIVSHSVYEYLQYTMVLVPFGQMMSHAQPPCLVYEVLRTSHNDDGEWMYNIEDVIQLNSHFLSIMNAIKSGDFNAAEAWLSCEGSTSQSITLLRDSCAIRSPLKFYLEDIVISEARTLPSRDSKIE